MAKSSPLGQLFVSLVVHGAEGIFGGTGAIVVGPTPDNGVDGRDKGGLRVAPVCADHIFNLEEVTSLGFLTGSDEGLEAWFAPKCSGTVFLNRELSDCETEEVKPRWAFVFVKGVADVGFTRFEPQSNLC